VLSAEKGDLKYKRLIDYFAQYNIVRCPNSSLGIPLRRTVHASRPTVTPTRPTFSHLNCCLFIASI